MRKCYKKTLIILLLALLFSAILGVSYAFFDKSFKNDDTVSLVETDEYISINYLDGKTFDIKEFYKDDEYIKRVSITNVSSSDTYVTVSLMDIDKTSNDIELTMLDSSGKEVYKNMVSNIDTELVKSVDLPAGKTLSYSIVIKNLGEDSTRFSANILSYKEIIKKSNNTFKDTILENNKVVSAKTEVGKQIASEDEGLIKTSDDDGTSYYFRGNVSNNNVTFADLNWKIIRINGDNSVRLVLDGAVDTSSPYNDNVEETDNYATKLYFSNSKIKEELDKWFNNNLKEFSKYIIDSTLCEDTESFKEENKVLYLNPYNRIFVDNIPTLTCMGNKVKYNIGLMTADEVEFAGASKSDANNNYFLYTDKISTSWWTMSGSKILENSNVVDAISVNPNGSLNYEKKISTSMAIRPIISLDSNVTVNGTGTSEDPYVIKVS